jgi:pimeloyl-ACP methyl ester carboxylesterase
MTILPQYRTIDGLSIRFAQSEDAHDVQALLLSPWPESLYAFEQAWPALAQHARLTAVDLPGFGHSEHSAALMTPSAMGAFIVKIADAFGLKEPHVVAPDVGTGAALFAAARYPRRFRSVIVGTGATAVPLVLGGPLKDWVEAPNLDAYAKIDGRQIVRGAMQNLAHPPSETARGDYLSSYAGSRFVESTSYVRSYPTELPILAELLETIDTPVKVIAGRNDPVVPLANADFLIERIPNSELAVLDANHFIWEDAATEYAAEVTKWWDGGYRKAGSATC